MNAFIDFFAHLTSLQKFIWIVGLLVVFWLLEGAYPLRKFKYKKWQHAFTNFVLLSTTIVINVLFGIATVGIFNWLEVSEFGVLNMVQTENLSIWSRQGFKVHRQPCC